jgi:hypothetical protein
MLTTNSIIQKRERSFSDHNRERRIVYSACSSMGATSKHFIQLYWLVIKALCNNENDILVETSYSYRTFQVHAISMANGMIT